MTISQRELANRLEHGPAVLLLGQGYLKLESGTDLFLGSIVEKFGSTTREANSYAELLVGSAQAASESALAWMHALSDRLSIPAWLRTVSGFAWSSVFSSAIDAIWWRSLRNDWRDTYPIYSSDINPSEPRSRTILHATFLYGCITQTEDAYRPPLNRREYLRRKQVATFLASRISEVVSPFGTLIIEGYGGKNDWLSPDDLVPVIDKLNADQVHLFHADDSLASDQDLAEFVASGKLTLHHEGLGEFLLESESNGYLVLGAGPMAVDSQRRVNIGSKPYEVPLDLWNQTRRSCSILSSAVVSETSHLSSEKNYQEFRRFLAESSIKPVWAGYARGYAFARDYQVTLDHAVDRQIRSSELQEEPIIIYGPSGTGKTVALGALAFDTVKKGTYPVLFIERKSQRPIPRDLDTFCKWAEDNSAAATLIVWDGMVEAYQYYELLRYLTGRGRKVLLVGSSYREFSDGKLPQRSNFISASQQLSDNEMKRLKVFLDRVDPGLGPSLIRLMDATFFVALYRLLPSTRAGIRTGLLSEVGHAEALIAQHAKTDGLAPLGSLGIALLKAGVLDVGELFAEKRKVGDEELATPQELVGLVMVPGRFGLKVPLDLLIRALDKQWLENIERIVQVDLFEMDEDEHGNITVAPRHPLEARLICQARFGTAQQEVVFAEKLIRAIRDDFSDEGQEVEFVVDLVRNMGPNGQDKTYFSSSFLVLSEVLSDLRTERSIQNPRLMLQEATLIREYVVSKIRSDSPPENAAELLDQAEETLRQSLQLIEDERRSTRLRSVVLVELGAILATRTTYLVDRTIEIEGSLPLYNQARESLLQARLLAPGDYHPVDIMLWLPQHLIESGKLNHKQKAEILADIYYLFTEANPEDFDRIQRDLYNQRRMRIATAIGDTRLSAEAFDALVAQGSTAGYFLRALEITGDLPQDREYSNDERRQFASAAKYLEEHRSAISSDGRCLFLLLRSWWGSKVGRPLFFSERLTVPLYESDWHYLIDVIENLLATAEGYGYPSLQYLWGIALFHVQQIEKAFQVFEDLERESDVVAGRRRITRSFLASLPNGEPREFHGTVLWADDNRNRGEIQVEELRRRISFLPLDFRSDLQKGDSISGGFHIAFNFIGPLADPRRFFRPQSRKDT